MRYRPQRAMNFSTLCEQAAGSPPALCVTSPEAPDALQASECNELLNPVRASCGFPPSRCMTSSEAPKTLQASECSGLLNAVRAN